MLRELDEVGQFEQALRLRPYLGFYAFAGLERVEKLVGGHFRRVHAETPVDICLQYVGDSRIVRLLPVRSPVFLVLVPVKRPERRHIRRLIPPQGSSDRDIPAQQPDYEKGQPEEEHDAAQPRQHLDEFQRIAHLSLEVVDLEGRGVDRHGLHIKFRRIEKQSVGPASRKSPSDGDSRQHITPLLEWRDHHAAADVHAALRSPHGVELPVPYENQGIIGELAEILKHQGGAGCDAVETETIFELIGY